MGRIHIEVGYWLSERMVPEQRGRLLLGEEVEEGQTLSGFLEGLEAKNSGFGEVIYDPQRRELYPWVQIIYNSRLIRCKDASVITLADGDYIGFQPMYAGG